MEPKLILPTLLALGVAFFYLSGDKKIELPGVGPLLSATNMADGTPWFASAAPDSPVLQAVGDPVPLGQLVDGVDAASISGPPAELQLITMAEDCVVTKPAAGQRVVPIMAQPSEVLTQIYSYDDDEFARVAAYEMDRVMSRGGEILADLNKLILNPRSNSSLDLITVIIPPGPEPVYLVLKDQNAGNVWNILTMPGATLDHVVLLAGGYSGVVNLPATTTLEVPNIGSGACGGFHRVIEEPAITKARGFVPSEETEAAWLAYNGWFTEMFGIPANTGLNSQDRATAVLAGAAPPEGAAKAVWQGVAGKVVHLMPNDVIYAAEEKKHEEWFRVRATAEITRAFGAPDGSDVLALIKPVIHERIN
jgi:hypothetical protein